MSLYDRFSTDCSILGIDMSKRRLARIPVTYELLAEALYLPEGTKVINVLESDYANTCELVVESPDLEEVGSGRDIPTRTPDHECDYEEGRAGRITSKW